MLRVEALDPEALRRLCGAEVDWAQPQDIAQVGSCRLAVTPLTPSAAAPRSPAPAAQGQLRRARGGRRAAVREGRGVAGSQPGTGRAKAFPAAAERGEGVRTHGRRRAARQRTGQAGWVWVWVGGRVWGARVAGGFVDGAEHGGRTGRLLCHRLLRRETDRRSGPHGALVTCIKLVGWLTRRRATSTGSAPARSSCWWRWCSSSFGPAARTVCSRRESKPNSAYHRYFELQPAST